ncbi:uncharacterized protein PITG_09958 [Phytophthora infestans T30-4]|uniref:Uncharacterized protein n=1 Tax=Phytophthora infestans (strain T30-4) TaxID=403677 RepID=D0NDY3_PHYIT|nr:uncharacterized protein PITG_09958 [Phytophthora infestans T30-4]EEY56428.1 conserved hypothetical protein [Phytophthora infestans T30-4]|eukprot:XP_002902502.1 conserved hypothetical protein [Phytophthora infestans T30-4]
MDIDSEPSRHYAFGPVSAQDLEMVVALYEDGNHYPPHRRKSRRAVNSIQEYFFNAKHYIVRDDNVHDLKLNGNRTKTHNASLRDRNIFEHDWDNHTWSNDEIKTIRRKFKCDCYATKSTGSKATWTASEKDKMPGS